MQCNPPDILFSTHIPIFETLPSSPRFFLANLMGKHKILIESVDDSEQSLEQVLVQINALNRSLEGIIEVSQKSAQPFSLSLVRVFVGNLGAGCLIH